MNDSTATEINARYNTSVYNGHLPQVEPEVKAGKAHVETLIALQAFTFASKIIHKNTTRAILLNANISFHEGYLGIEATDLEKSIKLEIPCDTSAAGAAILVPTSRILAILKASKAKKLSHVSFEVISSDTEFTKLKIEAGKNSYELDTMDPDEFPEIGSFNLDIDRLMIPMADFNEAVRRVAFSIAVERGRYALNGMYLEFTGTKLLTCGTDGKRLSMSEIDYECDSEDHLGNLNTIIPPRFLADAKAMFDENQHITYQALNGRIILRGKAKPLSKNDDTVTGVVEISQCLIEGNFPKFKDVIPQNRNTVISINRKDFLEALQDAAMMTSEESQAVKFFINTETNEWILSSRTPGAGKFEGKVDIKIDYVEDTEMSFDPRFIVDYVKQDKDADRIRVEMSGHKSPAMMYGAKGWSYLCSPINLE